MDSGCVNLFSLKKRTLIDEACQQVSGSDGVF